MKIRRKCNILELLDKYDAVIVDWAKYYSEYIELYESVYKNSKINCKYKSFVKNENTFITKTKPFNCYSSDSLEALVKSCKDLKIFYIL